jgi:hypothetical protein
MISVDLENKVPQIKTEGLDIKAVDNLALDLLVNSRIPNFAQCTRFRSNATIDLKYNVSGKVPLQIVLANGVDATALECLLLEIFDAISKLRDFMISPNTVVLRPEYVFVNQQLSDFALICLPLRNPQNASFPNFVNSAVASAKFSSGTSISPEHILSQVERKNATKQSVRVVSDDVLDAIQRGEGITNQTPSAHTRRELRHAEHRPASTRKVPAKTKQDHTEKKMSLLYLFAHYSKANSLTYKQQRGKKVKPQVKPKQTADFSIPGAN